MLLWLLYLKLVLHVPVHPLLTVNIRIHVHVQTICHKQFLYASCYVKPLWCLAISHHDLDANTAAEKCLNVASFKDAQIKHVRIHLATSRLCWLLGWLADWLDSWLVDCLVIGGVTQKSLNSSTCSTVATPPGGFSS